MNKNLINQNKLTLLTKNTSLQIRPSFSLVKISPYSLFFSGFTHSDGSFLVQYKISKNSINFSFNLNISIGISSLPLIYEISNFFKCGNIYITSTNGIFNVNNFLELWHIIIPHFINYPMYGVKHNSFKTFLYCMCLCFPYLNKSKPLNIILEVIRASYWMNEGTHRSLIDYNNLIEQVNKIYNSQFNSLSLIPYSPDSFNIVLYNSLYLQIQNLVRTFYSISLNFIKGIIEGDGSFIISFKQRIIYTFAFHITTSIKDIAILYLIQNRLGCGKIYIKADTWCRFEINKINDLNNIIIPLIDSLEIYRGSGNALLCSKAKTYLVWKEGIKKHLNNEISNKLAMRKITEENKIMRAELIKFITKAYSAFEGGKKRKLSLAEFLNLHNLAN